MLTGDSGAVTPLRRSPSKATRVGTTATLDRHSPVKRTLAQPPPHQRTSPRRQSSVILRNSPSLSRSQLCSAETSSSSSLPSLQRDSHSAVSGVECATSSDLETLRRNPKISPSVPIGYRPVLGRPSASKNDQIGSLDGNECTLTTTATSAVERVLAFSTSASGTPGTQPASCATSTTTSNGTLSRKLSRRRSVREGGNSVVNAGLAGISLENLDAGRVKVYVRVRPANETELTSDIFKPILSVNQEQTMITVSDTKREQTFTFDKVFSDRATNEEIFQTVGKPSVLAALNGFNGCVMAYGQTGTGKTHTLTSTDGLTPRLVAYLFQKITRDSRHDYKVLCSYMQIYNEKVYDLLVEGTKGAGVKQAVNVDAELGLRENAEQGVYVDGLSEFEVQSPEQVFDLIKLGRGRLVFAETKMNRASSRSHALCFLTVEKIKRNSSFEGGFEGAVGISGEVTEDHELSGEEIEAIELSDVRLRGRISICDLAGSERIKKTQATGDRLNEAQQINLSLLELGNVIHALTERNRSHVPFRNSTLTRLLQESLGGNCKTSLIVCVGPDLRDLSETKGTLAFGYRAMRVQNCARVNVEMDYKGVADALVAQLHAKEEDWAKREQELLQQLHQIRTEKEHTSVAQQEQLAQDSQELEKIIAEMAQQLEEKTRTLGTLQQNVDLEELQQKQRRERQEQLLALLMGATTGDICLHMDLAENNGKFRRLSELYQWMEESAQAIAAMPGYRKHVSRIGTLLRGLISDDGAQLQGEDDLTSAENQARLMVTAMHQEIQNLVQEVANGEASGANIVHPSVATLLEIFQVRRDVRSPGATIDELTHLQDLLADPMDSALEPIFAFLTLYRTALGIQLVIVRAKKQHGEHLAHQNATRRLEQVQLEAQVLRESLEVANQEHQSILDTCESAQAHARCVECENERLRAEVAKLQGMISLPIVPPKTTETGTQSELAAMEIPNLVPEEQPFCSDPPLCLVGEIETEESRGHKQKTPRCVVGGKECVIQ